MASDVEEERFEGNDLSDAMGKLDLAALPPPTPHEMRQCIEPTFAPTVSYPILAPPSYRSLSSIQGSAWEGFGTPINTTPAFAANETVYHGSGRTAKYRNNNQRNDDEAGLSLGLVNAIFRGITRRTGGQRVAYLSMDESGRWRVVRFSVPSETPFSQMRGE